MNRVQLNPLPLPVELFEEPEGACDRCIDGFFQTIEKVCSAVAHFFLSIFHSLCCCCTEEEEPNGLEVILTKPPISPIKPEDPFAPVLPIEPPNPPNPIPWMNPEPPRVIVPPPIRRYDPFNRNPDYPDLFRFPYRHPINPAPPTFRPYAPFNHPYRPAPVAPKPNPIKVPPVVDSKPDFKMEFLVPLTPKELPKNEEIAIVALPASPIKPSSIYTPEPGLTREDVRSELAASLNDVGWELSFDAQRINENLGTEYLDGHGQIAKQRPKLGEFIKALGADIAAYMGPLAESEREQLIKSNCDLIEAKDFIELINNYSPAYYYDPKAPIASFVDKELLDRFQLDIELDKDPEVTYKRRVARLALVWVAAKREQFEAKEDPAHPFKEIFDSLREHADSLKDRSGFLPPDNEVTLPHDYIHKKKYDRVDPKGDSPYTQVKRTLIGLQELSRVLPLIKEMASQKKTVRLEHRTREDFFKGVRGRTFKASVEVNYLRDIVLLMAQGFTRMHTYSVPCNNITLEEKDYLGKPILRDKVDSKTGLVKKTNGKSFPMNELDSDKIASFVEILWKTYHNAKENNDLEGFFKSLSEGGCFDKQLGGLITYSSKFGGPNPDFTLVEQSKFEDKIIEHRRLFVNEQIANFIFDRDPKMSYSELKKKVENASEVTDYPELKEFYTNYATTERFRAWIQTKNTLPENAKIPKLEVLKEESWKKITAYLDMVSLGFDQWIEE